ncbi:MAG: hypothetical protein HY999_00080 [Nitrospinae bacterium]|nr:hypothetical protein [Nitrospinota bacterium]
MYNNFDAHNGGIEVKSKEGGGIDFQIINRALLQCSINYTRLEGEIRVRRTERYAVEDFD